MNTKIATLFSLVLFSFVSHAQLSGAEYDSKQFNQFKASKTYVLLTGDQKFDTEMQETLADVWKMTPYEFISPKDFEAKMPDQSASFLLFFEVGYSSGMQEHYLCLVNGGKKKFSQYKMEDLVAYCPMNNFVNERNSVDCAYRLRNMIQSMLQSIVLVEKNSLRGNFFKIEEKLQEIYNKKAPAIANRTLLICPGGMLSTLTKADIAGVYPYKFEFCDQGKIEQAIKDKSTEYYYLQLATPQKRSLFVFDPATGEVLYYDFFTALSGMTIKKKHYEDLVDAIKEK